MCRWGFFILRIFYPKIKNKRKRPRWKRQAFKVFSGGVNATGFKVLEWSEEHKLNQTPAEIRYGKILQEIEARHHFRCQQPLYGYIIDFYAPAFLLAIEVDGGYHNAPEQMAYDAKRTRKLNDKGISVLRFTNEEVLSDAQKVMSITQEKIRACCRINKVKRRWRRNDGWKKQALNLADRKRKVPRPDSSFPADAFKIVEIKKQPIMIRHKDGSTERKEVIGYA